MNHIFKGKSNALIALLTIGVVLLAYTVVPAVTAASTTQPRGQMAYKFNIIGVPRDSASPGAEDGNGRRIFIPLTTSFYKDPCDTTGGQNNPDATSDPVLAPTNGVKIKVSEGLFDIVDGDAVADKEASFTMPAARYDVYIAAKGKPGGCLDLEAYTTLDTTLIFVGSVDIDRKTGKPQWQNIKNLLYGPGGEIFFADPYQDYFWQLYNNGLRNMEVRFYQVSS